MDFPRSYAEKVFLIFVVYICFGLLLFAWRRHFHRESGFSDPKLCASAEVAEQLVSIEDRMPDTDSSDAVSTAPELDTPEAHARIPKVMRIIGFITCGLFLQRPLIGQLFPHYTFRREALVVASILMLLSNAILVPQTTEEILGIEQRAGLCPAEREANWLKQISDNFDKYTSFSAALAQVENVSDFMDAIQRDVKRFGAVTHQCPNPFVNPVVSSGCPEQFRQVPTSIQEWNASGVFEPSKPFYSDQGWCHKVLLNNLNCQSNFLVDEQRWLPDPPPEVEVKVCRPDGWDFWINCVHQKVKVKQTLTTIKVPRKGHEHDSLVQKASDQWTEHRSRAEARRLKKEKLKERTFKREVRLEFEHPSNDATRMVMEQADKIVERASLASSLYTYYKIVGMIFPVPLKLFYEPMTFTLKRQMFTLRKDQFVLGIVLGMFFIEYIKVFIMDPRFRLFLEVALFLPHLDPDTCFLDRHFIRKVVEYLGTSCKQLQEFRSNYTYNLAVAELDVETARDFSFNPNITMCQCDFPTVDLKNFKSPTCPEGFKKQEPGWCAPKPDEPWHGNMTVCEDLKLIIEKVILSKQGPVDWWATFVRLQVLWRLIASIIACNFILSVLFLVDPLCLYAGRWMAPGDLKVDMDDRKQQKVLDMLRAPSLVGLILNGALLFFIATSMERAYIGEKNQHLHPEHDTVFTRLVKYVLIFFTVLAPPSTVVGACWFRNRSRT